MGMSKKISRRIQLWGGPLDGTTIPEVMAVMEFLEFAIVHNSVDKVCYMYEYRKDTNDFEYVGEETIKEDNE